MAKIDELLDLVAELCTIEQIKAVLEGARGNKAVRLSAANKGEYLQRNIREALNANAIPIEKIYDLLRESEENGNQHILFFKVPRALRDIMSFQGLASRLGISPTLQKTFPNIDLVPNGFVLADLRSLAPRKTHDWILKVYGDETREFFTGRVVPESGTKHLKEYDVRRYRHVLVVRWNFPDLLELRIPRETSLKRRTAWVDFLWKTIGSNILRSSLKPWDLSSARKKMIEAESLEGDLFSLRDTQVKMPGQERATFEPYLPGAGLFAAAYARLAVRDLLNANSTCTRLNVSWLPRQGTDFEEPIRTTVGTEELHEVIFPAHQAASEIDYVTDQLRKFN